MTTERHFLGIMVSYLSLKNKFNSQLMEEIPTLNEIQESTGIEKFFNINPYSWGFLFVNFRTTDL